MQSEISIILLRTLFLYFLILFILRVMGKREIGKISVFDLVVSIIIAEIAVFSIEDPKMPLLKGILPIILLAITQILLSYFSLKSKTLRNIIDGKPTIIIENGKINKKEMAKNRYNFDDLLLQLREKNITNVADVEFAILETTGQLSVTPKPEKSPVTREDLNIKPMITGIPIPVILDGQVLDQNLEKLNKNRLWLKQKLKRFGTTDFQRVLFASVDELGNLFVDLKHP